MGLRWTGSVSVVRMARNCSADYIGGVVSGIAIAGYSDLQLVEHNWRHYIHRARRISDGGSVIVKTAVNEIPTARAIAELRHEWEMLSGLHLPGVVCAYGLERCGAGLALIMEDAGPQNLAEHLAAGPLPVTEFLALAVQLTDAVARLHATRRMHRDLNPSNIALDETGTRAILLDFGMATTLTDEGGANATWIDGTLAYLSPEQTGRTGRSVDCRTDLYSLGGTFYKMLTGVEPFVFDDPLELVHAHLARRPTPVHEKNPSVPRLLSAIVAKLLAKAPEERYPSAESLLFDLREAAARWTRTGTLDSFPLARRHVPRELCIPDQLYGRDAEVRTLLDAFTRVCEGRLEIVLLTGDPGIGKSALVREIYAPMTERRGLFAAGKFDQLQRSIPYAGLAEAFRGLLRRLLTEDERSLSLWRDRLGEAVRQNGKVLIEVLPELALVLGPQPDVPLLDTEEAWNRFAAVFQRFVGALARQGSPLVLFLDDLQWADPASLKLLLQLLSEPRQKHLLVLCAYRDMEVSRDHPLVRAIDELRASEVAVRTIHLGPLGLRDVAKLCADALASDVERLLPLAELILGKTAGNPFFVRRFLRMLFADGLVRFDTSRGAWAFHLAAIPHAAVTENVADLMARSLERLPIDCRELLALGACVGNTFELGVLAAANGTPRPKTLNVLWAALEDGLLMPLGDAYRMPRQQGPHDELLDSIEASYRFAHDRVQEAALSLLDETQRRAAHLAIGRALFSRMSRDGEGKHLFDVVDHLNLGLDLIFDPAERLCIAALNLHAGSRAKGSGAHRAALDYLTAAARLLSADAFTTHPALALAIFRERAECAYLVGEHALANELIEKTLAHAPSRADALALLNLRVVAMAMAGDYAGALAHGREALALVGEVLPTVENAAAATQKEREAVAAVLSFRPIAALLELPPMRNEDELATMQLLVDLIFPAYVRERSLFEFLAARTAALSVKYGHSPHAPYVFALFGVSYGVASGDWASAHAFGKLGVDLGRRLGNPVELCRALQAFGHYECWRAPRRASESTLREAIRVGFEAGELRWGAYATTSLVEVLFSMGAPLSAVLDEVERWLPLCERQKNRLAIDRLLTVRQAARCLLGRTRTALVFDDDVFEEADFTAQAAPISLGLYEIARLMCLNVFGDFAGARRLAEASFRQLPFVGAYFARAEHAFHAALAYAVSCDAASESARAAYKGMVREQEAKLAEWAEGCPENFAHKRDLVRAELARLRGDPWLAQSLYESAIEAAHEQGFMQDVALTEERACQFQLTHGQRRLAQLHCQAAIEAYARWGATAKVAALQRAHRDLLRLQVESPAETRSGARTSYPSEPEPVAFDMLSLIKATQAISGELLRERLLEKLLRVVLETAGAERGALVLDEEDGQLAVAASATVEGGVSIERESLGDHWPRSAIYYVARTGEPVVLRDARVEGAFIDDVCVRARKIRSVLCVPVRWHGRRAGVVYLENNALPHAFTRDRIEVVRHLATQLAISLENARLLRETQDAVRTRDDFLLIAAHELRTPLTPLVLALGSLLRDVRRNLAPETADKMGEKIALATRQVTRMRELVEMLLDISQITVGRLKLEKERVDLAEVAREAAARFESSLAEAGATLLFAAGGPVFGRWDRMRLDQVVSNLLANAIKFGAGQPIELAVKTREGVAVLSVKDHGTGIALKDQARIFGRFERATPVTHYGGFGLGLWIVQQLVAAHGGTIHVKSKPGAGAQFIVELPIGE